MTSAITPYLQIDTVGTELRLYGVEFLGSIRPGSYEVCGGDSWFKVVATEKRGSTAVGPPTRSVELHGYGPAAEQLLLLEKHILSEGGSIQIRNTAETFDIASSRISSSVFVTGVFLVEGDGSEFKCRLTLPEGKEIIGVAIDDDWHDRRVLFITELDQDSRLALIRARVGGADLLVEQIPWNS